MTYKFLGLYILLISFYFLAPRAYTDQSATAEEKNAGVVQGALTIKTQTAFDQKEETETTEIPFEKEYEDDDDLEYGLEEVKEEGVNGKKENIYLVTFWQDETIDRQLISTKVTEPKPEKIAKGKKVVWRQASMPDAGTIKYWRKIKVWATKYDANCIGCTGRTYSGTQVKKGVCAVDPKVITMGDYFYVEGYGLCKAADIGGAIKGEKIDLGYENAKTAPWTTRYTNIYLLTPPKNLD